MFIVFSIDCKCIIKLKIYPFFEKMEYVYGASDLIISRAGALSVAEICLAGKAAILVPSPNVAEDHQTKNCMALVERNAGLLVKDDQAAGRLVSEAIRLINDEQLCHQLAENIAPLARPDAAQQIAREVLAMIKK